MDIAADFRWVGPHGIGRFAREVLSRLGEAHPMDLRLGLLHPLDSIAQTLWLVKNRPRAYFNPGFNPPAHSPVPFVFVIHDLIHIRYGKESSWSRRAYYATVVRPAAFRAFKVLTVSEFSRREILEWSGLPESSVQVVSNGVSSEFSEEGEKYDPGYPYILCIGSRKPHKNIERLLRAYALSGLSHEVGLVCTGQLSNKQLRLIDELDIESYVSMVGVVADADLPKYYRGALAHVFPSLYEGFGLPPLEAIASGTPVVASSSTAIPEVLGDAAIYVDPRDIESIAEGMRAVVADDELRKELRQRGLMRARQFSWDRTAGLIRQTLQEAAEGGT